MQKRGLSTFFLYLFGNYWYIPLFGILIGMKLCIVMMLVESIQKNEGMSPAPFEFLEKSVGDNWRRREESYNGARMSFSNFSSSNNTKFIKQKSNKKFTLEIMSKPSTIISSEKIREWKILANLENSIINCSAANRTELNSVWLIFNRVPSCSEEIIVDLLVILSKENEFIHQKHEYRTPWARFLKEHEQENLVTWFEYQHLPKSYDRHFFFVNFTFFQRYIKEKPIYINLVRDPMTRLLSSFQAKRADAHNTKQEISRRDEDVPGSGLAWYHKSFEDCVMSQDPECLYGNGTEDFTMSVPFFCGQHPNCVIVNNKWAVQRAKFTIEKYYSVVGVLEHLVSSLTAFENYVPRFFKGVTKLYQQGLDSKKRTMDSIDRRRLHQKKLLQNVRRMLEKQLPGEFDLYRFILERLKAQLSFLKGKI